MIKRWWHALLAGQVRAEAQEGMGAGMAAVPLPRIMDRGAAVSAGGGTLRSRMSNLLGIVLLALVCAGFLSWYYSHAAARRSNAAPRSTPAAAKGDFVLPPLNIPKSQVPSATPAVTGSLVTDTAYAVGNVLDGFTSSGQDAAQLLSRAGSMTAPAVPAAQVSHGNDYKSPWELARERRLDNALWIRQSVPTSPLPNSDRAAGVTQTAGFAAAGSDGAHSAPASRALNELLRPAVVVAAQAEVLPSQRLLLPKGAFIDCTLETAIDSTLPGLATCITPVDTYSADGTVVLLERGTKLIGETRGDVQQGSARVFVLWTEARTPLGVIVPLASPGTDELGRSGLPGDANHHFFERFGAAILVSVIDGAMQVAANSRSDGASGSTIVMNPSGTQDVLTEVLRNTISIPPTVSKSQGDRIEILVARDLDFRSVYQLRLQ